MFTANTDLKIGPRSTSTVCTHLDQFPDTIQIKARKRINADNSLRLILSEKLARIITR